MDAEQTVKEKYPDAEISTAFVKQADGSRRWMYCVMSPMKFVSSRGKYRVLNVGPWRYSEQKAWQDAATQIQQHPGLTGRK